MLASSDYTHVCIKIDTLSINICPLISVRFSRKQHTLYGFLFLCSYIPSIFSLSLSDNSRNNVVAFFTWWRTREDDNARKKKKIFYAAPHLHMKIFLYMNDVMMFVHYALYHARREMKEDVGVTAAALKGCAGK